jgi:nucleoside-diphosphate-sugar epimerase
VKVLVTGATGFIGRHVVSQLLNRGHSVIAVARDEARARTFPWFDRVSFVACDVHDRSVQPSALFGRSEAVMHLAWPGLPNYGELYHFEQNLHADYRFLKSLVEAGCGQILVTGTCFEYGMQNGCLNEDMLTQPANPYALAKVTLRKCLQALRVRHPFTLQWARLFYLYGPGQNPNSLLAQLDRAIDNNEPVFNMSGGEQLRDYLPVETVALYLVRLLEHRECAGVFNICSGVPVSIRSLVERHLAQRGAHIRLNLGFYPYPGHEPMAFWGDARKISAVLKAE